MIYSFGDAMMFSASYRALNQILQQVKSYNLMMRDLRDTYPKELLADLKLTADGVEVKSADFLERAWLTPQGIPYAPPPFRRKRKRKPKKAA